jgi:transcriptional regulator with XRE-family HTH domain
MRHDETPFGARLRATRLGAGMSLAQLARRVHYSKGYLSKVETGKAPAGEDLARRCDAALGAGGRLTAAAPSRPSPVRAVEAREEEREEQGYDGIPLVGRRDVLIGGTVSLLGAGTGLRSLRAAAVEEGTDRAFLSTLGDLRRQGWARPPALLLPTLVAQTQAAAALATMAPSRRRADLLFAASRLAEFTGWMYQEADDLGSMRRWTDRAVTCADEAGDPILARYVQIRYANVALYSRDGAATVELARAAADRSAPSRLAGLAVLREAAGRALLGDDDRVRRCLDRGQELLDQAPTPDARSTLGMSSPVDQVALVRGWCLYDLGRPDEAAAVLGEELARVTPHARRTRARFGARLPLAQAAGAPQPWPVPPRAPSCRTADSSTPPPSGPICDACPDRCSAGLVLLPFSHCPPTSTQHSHREPKLRVISWGQTLAAPKISSRSTTSESGDSTSAPPRWGWAMERECTTAPQDSHRCRRSTARHRPGRRGECPGQYPL